MFGVVRLTVEVIDAVPVKHFLAVDGEYAAVVDTVTARNRSTVLPLAVAMPSLRTALRIGMKTLGHARINMMRRHRSSSGAISTTSGSQYSPVRLHSCRILTMIKEAYPKTPQFANLCQTLSNAHSRSPSISRRQKTHLLLLEQLISTCTQKKHFKKTILKWNTREFSPHLETPLLLQSMRCTSLCTGKYKSRHSTFRNIGIILSQCIR